MMRRLLLLCLILFTAACDLREFGWPLRDDFERAQPPTAVPTVEQSSPVLIIPDVQSVSLRIEASVEGSGRSGSFFGGEAVFQTREDGLIPDFYLTYRLPDFGDDVALLVLDGTSYTRSSRFAEWRASPVLFDIQLLPGMTPVQLADSLFGFTLSLEQWEQVGTEMLDGRETDRYRRTYQPQPGLWESVIGRNFAGVERVDLDLWVSSADNLPRRLQMALLARLTSEEDPTLVHITINIGGYNEPVMFPSPF
jgi:hypothetical protein